MNPLERYRRAQLRLRALFDPFTARHCAACATPCCRKPARIRPVDLILVEELGFKVAPVSAAPELAGEILSTARAGLEEAAEPCDYLGATGCRFPRDLRPFGCTAFICEPMRRLLPPDEMAHVETAVAELASAHDALMQVLHQSPEE
ncbi:MAG: hypothetical protein ACK47B_24305 [Armatimonadota bacterium]